MVQQMSESRRTACSCKSEFLNGLFILTLEAMNMQKWCTEDWQFELTAIEGRAGHCRLGLEKGDKFVFSLNVLQECALKQ